MTDNHAPFSGIRHLKVLGYDCRSFDLKFTESRPQRLAPEED